MVLTLPLCGLLRAELGADVLLLARRYTAPVAEASDAVTALLDWDSVASAPRAEQVAFLRDARADTLLHVFPRADVAWAARRSGIARRIGTSHRWFHWLTCNALVPLGRRSSDLHEAQLNVGLARNLLRRTDHSLAELAPFGRLTARGAPPARVAALIEPGRVNVAFQMKSRGSSREWPLERWRELAELLDPSRYRIFVLGTADERALVAAWLDSAPPHVVDLTGLDLRELIATLARLDGIVSASTGPLHLGAALSIHALALHSPTPPVHPGRWAPLGAAADYIVAPESCAACRAGRQPCTCMAAITAREVAERIARWQGI